MRIRINHTARLMLQAAIEYLGEETGLERVVFCLYGRPAFDVFSREMAAQANQASPTRDL